MADEKPIALIVSVLFLLVLASFSLFNAFGYYTKTKTEVSQPSPPFFGDNESNESYFDGVGYTNLNPDTKTGGYTATTLVYLSDNLSSGVNFAVENLPSDDAPAEGNNGIGGTTYWVQFYSDVRMNLYFKASGNLVDRSSGTTIPLNQETFRYSTVDPTVNTYYTNSTLTNLYVNNTLLYRFIGKTTVYMKFFLDISGGQTPGQYFNNLSFYATKKNLMGV